MPEKRIQRRYKKRLSLRFTDPNDLIRGSNRLAFTEEISRSGIFIRSSYVVRPGSHMEILIDAPGGSVRLEAQVMWAKKVQASFMRHASKPGMGVQIIRFIEGEAWYRGLCDEMDSK